MSEAEEQQQQQCHFSYRELLCVTCGRATGRFVKEWKHHQQQQQHRVECENWALCANQDARLTRSYSTGRNCKK